ncbi:MAG: hypothetical protein K6F58_05650 [Bacteroidales bacterium]|nr:hypothetical protein [Bacteroidales bacterium]
MTVSCSKYTDTVSLIVNGDEYRSLRSFGKETQGIRKYTDGDVLYFNYYGGPLFFNKTEDVFSYYVSFEVFIKEDVFVSGSKIPITEDFSEEEWYNKKPKEFGTLESTKASLKVYRHWRNGPVSKSYSTDFSKEFSAINGWIRIIESDTLIDNDRYSAEYKCDVVAYDDGETLKVRGSFKL